MWKRYHSFLCGCRGDFHVLIWLGHSAWIFGDVVNYYKCLCEVLFCCLIHIPFWSVCVESSLGFFFFFFLIESQFISGWCATHLKLTKFYPRLSLSPKAGIEDMYHHAWLKVWSFLRWKDFTYYAGQILLSTWHKLESIWEQGTSTKSMVLLDRPVGKSGSHFLDD